jgi:steroid delta-isomerase-like uncharacterized protein
MSMQENTTIVRRYLEEILTQNQIAAVPDYVTTDYVNHLLPSGTLRGPAGDQQLIAELHSGFPGFNITIQDAVDEGHKVAVRFRFQGVHTGTFQGIPATGKRVDVQGINIFHLQGAKIKENWPSLDMLGLLQQIGALPTPSPQPVGDRGYA